MSTRCPATRRSLVGLALASIASLSPVATSAQPPAEEAASLSPASDRPDGPTDEATSSVETPVEAPSPLLSDSLTPTAGGLTADAAALAAVATASRVRRNRVEVERFELRETRARESFIPRTDITASYTRLSDIDQPPFPGAPPGTVVFPVLLDNYALRASVAVPVSDYFLSILPALEGAHGFLEASHLQMEVARQDAAQSAREAFYNHVGARAANWVAEQTVSSLGTTLEHVEALFQGGMITSADVSAVRAQVASATAQRSQTAALVQITERALKTVMHDATSGPFVLGEDIAASNLPEVPTIEQIIAEAREQRAEVLALQALIRGNESLGRSRGAQAYPHLSLFGNVEYSNPNQRVFPQSEEFTGSWSAGVALTWSPNDFLDGIRQRQEFDFDTAQLREDLIALEDGLTVQITEAVANYGASLDAIVAQEEAVRAASHALEQRQLQLAGGAATTTDIVTAHLELTRAQLGLVNAQVGAHLAHVHLLRARGAAAPPSGEQGQAP